MRYYFTLILLLAPSVSCAKQIVLDPKDQDIAIVENDVIDADEWVRTMWAGKLARCKERIIQAEIKKSIEEGSPIPSTEDEIIKKYLSRPEYKNRKDRDAQEAKDRIPLNLRR